MVICKILYSSRLKIRMYVRFHQCGELEPTENQTCFLNVF